MVVAWWTEVAERKKGGTLFLGASEKCHKVSTEPVLNFSVDIVTLYFTSCRSKIEHKGWTPGTNFSFGYQTQSNHIHEGKQAVMDPKAVVQKELETAKQKLERYKRERQVFEQALEATHAIENCLMKALRDTVKETVKGTDPSTEHSTDHYTEEVLDSGQVDITTSMLGKRPRDTEPRETVLIHVYSEAHDDLFLVPVEELEKWCAGKIKDVLKMMQEQNGFHADQVPYSNRTMALEFEYITYLIGSYIGDPETDYPDFFFDPKLRGIFQKYKLEGDARFRLPTATPPTYFFSRCECSV